MHTLASSVRVWYDLHRDGKFYYSDAEPPNAIMQSFMRRGDNQIMCLEILSIAFGKFAGAMCVWVLALYIVRL
jgi:predicted secreted protein